MNFNPNIAHIVYASDDRFAEILGVSLVSLYENSRDMGDIIVYVLDSGIKEENKNKLLSVSKNYGRTDVQFIPAKDISQKLEIKVATDRGNLSQYARLFVSSDLPENLGRILYLDCDIIIKQSISELWNLNLHGKIIGALMDAFSKYYRANIGLEENDIMFNSGVMLIDLDKWRENQVEDKLLEFISRKNGWIQQGDQGALNAILSKDTYCFEPRFNSVTIFYDFNYKEMMIYRRPPRFYTQEEVCVAVDNPMLIHFTTSFKSIRPWVIGCKHRYVSEWYKHKEMSPWKDSELWNDNRPQWKKRFLKLYNTMPNWISVRIAGLMQVYGRPLRNRLRK
ncbi:glycosyltransferase family 8 protein [Enterococcus faecium]|uniref:glycosyltransferase family 8 protein n=1 Tax=Enterococcus faecium TaxID=1352 RepID=UPI000F4D68C8|nr:glycosyltransferase family 8 protein [Enterococcus faecium]ROZ26559.1 glycosyltransferase family 8 protein [Enterococcus faecium]